VSRRSAAFLFAPRYLDRDGLSLHYVDEGHRARPTSAHVQSFPPTESRQGS
jgi:hypothetical protein